MASTNLSKAIGAMYREKGLLKPGRQADIVVLDKNLNVVMTIVSGKIVYRSSNITP